MDVSLFVIIWVLIQKLIAIHEADPVNTFYFCFHVHNCGTKTRYFEKNFEKNLKFFFHKTNYEYHT